MTVMGFDIERFVNRIAAEEQMKSEGMCSCCRGLWRDPVTLSGCGHVFCSKCITAWTSLRKSCPYCRRGLKYGDWVTMTSEIMPPGVRDLKMNCVNGCGVVSTPQTFNRHHTHCRLRQEKWAAIYNQLLQEKKLPLGTQSPWFKMKAHYLYEALPE